MCPGPMICNRMVKLNFDTGIFFSVQHIDNATKNEVRRFVFSGPLTPNGVALRDVTLTKK